MVLRSMFVLLCVAAFSVHAEVKLTDKDILGSWQIDSESLKSDGSGAKKTNSIWTFRDDGTMEGSTIDSDVNARSAEIRAVVTYRVEEGKIVKQSVPGRSKFETCTAVAKEGQKMTLECSGIYFSMTKK